MFLKYFNPFSGLLVSFLDNPKKAQLFDDEDFWEVGSHLSLTSPFVDFLLVREEIAVKPSP